MSIAAFINGGFQGYQFAAQQEQQEIAKQQALAELYRFRQMTPGQVQAVKSQNDLRAQQTRGANLTNDFNEATAYNRVQMSNMDTQRAKLETDLQVEVSKIAQDAAKAHYANQQRQQAMRYYSPNIPGSEQPINQVFDEQGVPISIGPDGQHLSYDGNVIPADQMWIHNYLSGNNPANMNAVNQAQINAALGNLYPNTFIAPSVRAAQIRQQPQAPYFAPAPGSQAPANPFLTLLPGGQ